MKLSNYTVWSGGAYLGNLIYKAGKAGRVKTACGSDRSAREVIGQWTFVLFSSEGFEISYPISYLNH